MCNKITCHSAFKIARALKKWGYILDDELETVAEMLNGFELRYKSDLAKGVS